MNNPPIKKWTILLALLAVTLILVWQAPEPEPIGSVVEPKHSEAVRQRSAPIEPNRRVRDDIEIRQRVAITDSVDVFDSPKVFQPAPSTAKPVARSPLTQVQVPFRYIGMLEEKQQTTYFLMEGPVLYLVKEGDTVRDEFRLQSVDRDNKELIWLYLPLNETRKMSMEK
jgi:hypothetical protein